RYATTAFGAASWLGESCSAAVYSCATCRALVAIRPGAVGERGTGAWDLLSGGPAARAAGNKGRHFYFVLVLPAGKAAGTIQTNAAARALPTRPLAAHRWPA